MLISGLSPRLRGNGYPTLPDRTRPGSIPALAGERPAFPRVWGMLWVYPRACGGTVVNTIATVAVPGLSPRLRGNAHQLLWPTPCAGSIPALAGERLPCPLGCLSVGVYPRACGGTFVCGVWFRFVRGLSPRLRGNVGNMGGGDLHGGSIPALAGERSIHGFISRSTRVYPRACGGTSGVDKIANSEVGLSPRLRGNDRNLGFRIAGRGSIPALAGERCTMEISVAA